MHEESLNSLCSPILTFTPPRLKSRHPIWSNLLDEAPTFQPLWRTRWQNQIVDVPNKSLINDPTIQLPGMNLSRDQWSLLNRFRTDAGQCRNSMHEWGYIASPPCDCGEQQTMRHIVNECPLTCFDGGISELHTGCGLHLAAETELENVKANDNNNNNNDSHAIAARYHRDCLATLYTNPPPSWGSSNQCSSDGTIEEPYGLPQEDMEPC